MTGEECIARLDQHAAAIQKSATLTRTIIRRVVKAADCTVKRHDGGFDKDWCLSCEPGPCKKRMMKRLHGRTN